jgi:crotonobetainyl-CoA:carnitine CoA-transferase CaiB-like acyl-CoA transferase
VTAGSPLGDVRVVDLSRVLAGPYCTMMLADLGADVIKVERPGDGDETRSWGPPYAGGEAAYFLAVNRSKRSVAVDLKQADGRALVLDLCARADVVLENFRPGTLTGWGLDYESLSAINPRLIMVHVSGFGQTGPRANDAGFGSIGEAMGGLRELTGSPDRPPARAAVSMGDQIAGLFAAFGTVAALRQVDRDGKGQVVDVALYEAVFALMESLVADYEHAGDIRARSGGTLPGVAPSNAYPTADGHMVMIAANADAIFVRLAEAMGRPELATDPRYSTHGARGERMQELDDIVNAWSSTLDFDAIDKALEAAGVPHGLIYRAPDMLADPHYVARETIQRVHDAVLGTDVPMAAIVPRLTRTPGRIRWPGADVGAHTHEVLAELGLAAEERAALVDAGVVPEA